MLEEFLQKPVVVVVVVWQNDVAAASAVTSYLRTSGQYFSRYE